MTIYCKNLRITSLLFSDKPCLIATNSRNIFFIFASAKKINISIYWLRPDKTNFSPINQLQLMNNSWVTTNQHFIKSSWNDHINMVTVMNCLHLLIHHDIDHFHHYFGNDQETNKKSLTKWNTLISLLV